MIHLHARSAKQISTEPLPGPSFVLRMADEESLLADIKDKGNVLQSFDILFNDADADYGLVRAPRKSDAQFILDAFHFSQDHWTHRNDVNFVAQCQAGKGRSHAVIAALCRKLGRDNSSLLRNGSYNRKLYDLLLEEMGIPNPQPLVSIVVRVKYGTDRLEAFMLSMRRQRHTNWEAIAVTDGPVSDATFKVIAQYCSFEDKLKVIQTPAAKGRWGHPYRQLGIDAARGEYIAINNDDNILTPGYIEQMLFAIQEYSADLAVCRILHSYSGWDIAPEGTDLGSWLAKAELVRRHPWTGTEADYEEKYLNELCADGFAVKVPRPLFMHN